MNENTVISLLEIETEAFRKAMTALNVAHAASMDVFTALEGDALESEELNPCLEVTDRIIAVGTAMTAIESQLAGVQLQLAYLNVFESAEGLPTKTKVAQEKKV